MFRVLGFRVFRLFGLRVLERLALGSRHPRTVDLSRRRDVLRRAVFLRLRPFSFSVRPTAKPPPPPDAQRSNSLT